MSKHYSEDLFLALFSFTHQWEEMWPGGAMPMLSLLGFLWPKYCFGFFWPGICTGRSVSIYMYLKHSPDNSDPKCIGYVCVLFPKYYFWHFEPYTMREKGGTRPMLLPESAFQVLDL